MGATHHFGRSVQFFEEKCSASDLYSDTKYKKILDVDVYD